MSKRLVIGIFLILLLSEMNTIRSIDPAIKSHLVWGMVLGTAYNAVFNQFWPANFLGACALTSSVALIDDEDSNVQDQQKQRKKTAAVIFGYSTGALFGSILHQIMYQYLMCRNISIK